MYIYIFPFGEYKIRNGIRDALERCQLERIYIVYRDVNIYILQLINWANIN